MCRLFPQAVEGPFYFDPSLVRSDISEARPGLPTLLALRVIEMTSCKPIAGARVDVWHADAEGHYSGYDGQGDGRRISTVGQKFLRGTQFTDANGDVSFRSVYPGWYQGRTPHIHLKVFLDQKTVLTGQMYFPDAMSARIYAERAPYAARPKADRTNEQDGLYREAAQNGGGIVLLIDEASEPLKASLVIAVDRSGDAARFGDGWIGRMRRRLGI